MRLTLAVVTTTIQVKFEWERKTEHERPCLRVTIGRYDGFPCPHWLCARR